MNSKIINPVTLVIVALTFLQISQILIFDYAYFPIDDAYIYFQQAENLIKGHFFTYSIGSELTNSNTSIFFYFVSALISIISKLLANYFSIESVFLVVIVSTFLNILFASGSAVYLRKISGQITNSIKKDKAITLLVFTTPALIFSFINGLETGLTIFLILVQYYFFSLRKYKFFTIISLILSIHRPENIVLNFAYIFLLLSQLRNSEKKQKKRYLFVVVIFLSCFITPILNLYFTGDIRSAGAARTQLPNLLNLFNNLSSFIGVALTNPGSLPMHIDNFLMILRYGFTILILIFSITKSLNFFKKKNIKYFLKNMHKPKFSIPLVILSYISLPLIVGSGAGEWARYLTPALPLFYVFLFAYLCSERILKFVLFVNFLMFTTFVNSYLNLTSIYSSAIHPAARQIKKITTDNDITSIDSAGFLAHHINGKIIDVYGLGTTRYMQIHGDFDRVYESIKNENINYIITWLSKTPTYYLDSAHYEKVFGENNLKQISKFKVSPFTILDKFPEYLVIYKVENITR